MPQRIKKIETLKDKIIRKLILLLVFLVLILLLPIIVLVVILIFIPWLIKRLILLNRVRIEWILKGKYILFVYSDNPLWKEYAEQNIIPRIASKSYVLNWSEKFKWLNDDLLEVKLFKHFNWGREWIWLQKIRMGGQKYNHMAIVFYPWWKPRKFSFWPAFKDYEFGNKESLEKIETEFNNYIENIKQ